MATRWAAPYDALTLAGLLWVTCACNDLLGYRSEYHQAGTLPTGDRGGASSDVVGGRRSTAGSVGSDSIGGVAGTGGSYAKGGGGGGGTTSIGTNASGGRASDAGAGSSNSSGGGAAGGDFAGGHRNSGGAAALGGNSVATGGGTNGGSAGVAACIGPLPASGPVSSCPTGCSNCNGGVCYIDCYQKDCSNASMLCPAGMPCVLDCAGQKSCQDATVTCRSEYGCTISCSGVQACGGLAIDCTQGGACMLSCGANNKACESTTVLACGVSDCRATCAGGERPSISGCEQSCRRSGCGCH